MERRAKKSSAVSRVARDSAQGNGSGAAAHRTGRAPRPVWPVVAPSGSRSPRPRPPRRRRPAFRRPASGPKVSRTLTTDLFEQIRSDILHNRLEPGSRLLFRDMRERYRSGLSPLREALMRLVSEGLVLLEDHKGFRVAPVSREEMIDIANTLLELEAIAIRMAVEKGDDRWEAQIVARYHELSKREMFAADGTLDAEWEARNVAFHEALYEACGSPSLEARLPPALRAALPLPPAQDPPGGSEPERLQGARRADARHDRAERRRRHRAAEETPVRDDGRRHRRVAGPRGRRCPVISNIS